MKKGNGYAGRDFQVFSTCAGKGVMGCNVQIISLHLLPCHKYITEMQLWDHTLYLIVGAKGAQSKAPPALARNGVLLQGSQCSPVEKFPDAEAACATWSRRINTGVIPPSHGCRDFCDSQAPGVSLHPCRRGNVPEAILQPWGFPCTLGVSGIASATMLQPQEFPTALSPRGHGGHDT